MRGDEAQIALLRAALHTAMARLEVLERRMSDHDRQIAGLEDSSQLHMATLAAFAFALAEIGEVRHELGLLRGDVAEASEP